MRAVTYDPERDPYEALNADLVALGDTPIGVLRVVPYCGRAAVAVVRAEDPRRVERVVHLLEPGEHPTVAVYGRRLHEAAHVERLYARQQAGLDRLDERADEELSRDFVRRLDDFVRDHHHDGGEALSLLVDEGEA